MAQCRHVPKRTRSKTLEELISAVGCSGSGNKAGVILTTDPAGLAPALCEDPGVRRAWDHWEGYNVAP